MIISLLFFLILIISAIFHEYAHGWVAYKLGDHTAKDAGRLTLNPLAHIDPIGTIMLPLLLFLSKSSFMIGWAKPVPYNPYNLRDPKYGDLKVALGGPGTNLALAVFFGLLARFMPILGQTKVNLIAGMLSANNDTVISAIQGSFAGSMFLLASIFCFVNLVLMIFNLIPIPPLDGSKIIQTFLPPRWQLKYHQYEIYGFFVLILLLWSGVLDFIFPLILSVFSLIVGI